MEYPTLKSLQSHILTIAILNLASKICIAALLTWCIFNIWLLAFQLDCIWNQLKASLLSNIEGMCTQNEIIESRKPILNLGPAFWYQPTRRKESLFFTFYIHSLFRDYLSYCHIPLWILEPVSSSFQHRWRHLAFHESTRPLMKVGLLTHPAFYTEHLIFQPLQCVTAIVWLPTLLPMAILQICV